MRHFETFSVSFTIMSGSGSSVRVSDSLSEAAREAAEWSDRSVAGQIEHWAKLGRSVEAALSTSEIESLKKFHPSSRQDTLRFFEAIQRKMPYSQIRDRVMQIKANENIYEEDADDPSIVICTTPEGRRTHGEMVDGEFVPFAKAQD